jgi:4-hydroxybenzoate polyprenyltransferase
MQLTIKDLEIIARARVSKPYKKRICIASAVTVAAIIGAGLPGGSHIWQLVLVPSVAAIYFIYAIWQGKALDRASQKQIMEWQNELENKKVQLVKAAD